MRPPLASSNAPLPFLSFGFRPFFMAASLAAPLLIAPWLLFLSGLHSVQEGMNALEWHAHEMIFGFVGAALAGFLLTAVANWTGRPPVRGALLGALLVAWLAGRIAMSGITGLSPTVVMLVDVVFPFFLFFLVTREILGASNQRNLPLIAIIGLFALTNVVFHLGASRGALNLALHLLLLLVTVIGGRVIPAFTGNWLRARGATSGPFTSAPLEKLLVPTVIFVGIADTVATGSALAGAVAGALAVLNGFRLAGWQGVRARSDPLVAVLHIAYGWLVVGYLLLAAAAFTDFVPRSAALHALAAGGIGTMILAISSRASLGHTGRPLRAPAAAVLAYCLVGVGAGLRVLAFLFPAFYGVLLWAAGTIWASAFLVFAIGYFRILTGPRVESG